MCAAAGWRWTMMLGVLTVRDPDRSVSVRTQQPCPGCSGAGTYPVSTRSLGRRRLPAL